MRMCGSGRADGSASAADSSAPAGTGSVASGAEASTARRMAARAGSRRRTAAISIRAGTGRPASPSGRSASDARSTSRSLQATRSASPPRLAAKPFTPARPDTSTREGPLSGALAIRTCTASSPDDAPDSMWSGSRSPAMAPMRASGRSDQATVPSKRSGCAPTSPRIARVPPSSSNVRSRGKGAPRDTFWALTLIRVSISSPSSVNTVKTARSRDTSARFSVRAGAGSGGAPSSASSATSATVSTALAATRLQGGIGCGRLSTRSAPREAAGRLPRTERGRCRARRAGGGRPRRSGPGSRRSPSSASPVNANSSISNRSGSRPGTARSTKIKPTSVTRRPSTRTGQGSPEPASSGSGAAFGRGRRSGTISPSGIRTRRAFGATTATSTRRTSPRSSASQLQFAVRRSTRKWTSSSGSGSGGSRPAKIGPIDSSSIRTSPASRPRSMSATRTTRPRIGVPRDSTTHVSAKGKAARATMARTSNAPATSRQRRAVSQRRPACRCRPGGERTFRASVTRAGPERRGRPRTRGGSHPEADSATRAARIRQIAISSGRAGGRPPGFGGPP